MASSVGAGDHPEWPDKVMFAAILLILAGFVGATFRLLLPAISVEQDNLPTIFTDEIPGYELILCIFVLFTGVLALWRQAAVFVYTGAFLAIISIAVYGLVPFLGILAIAAMVKSHLEGEETRNDGIQLHSSLWPDKAMAASLFMVVAGSIAILQGILIFAGRFEPIVLGKTVAGSTGIAVGILGFVAASNVYNLRRPWLGWTALITALLTLGFYLIGPVLAIVGMVLLWMAHKEDEFRKHAAQTAVENAPVTTSATKTVRKTPAKKAAGRKAAPK